MKIRLTIALLLIYRSFLISFAEIPDIVGAWKGPDDLMINLCFDGSNNMYVCQCGIFRTFGWVNVEHEFRADSLLLKSTDYGSPFEGRFRIVSADRMIGTLKMGNPGEDWCYDGCAELAKEKPVMPENLNHNLEGIVNESDYGPLSLDRELVRNMLGTLIPASYGYKEKTDVERLLNAKTYPVTPEDMIGFRRVRSIQIAASDGIFSYPYFNCRFKSKDGKIFFEKTTGSQRKAGYIYQNGADSLIFLGGWSVNDEPQTQYGSSNSVAGTVYKTGQNTAIMIFPTENNRVEIYELRK